MKLDFNILINFKVKKRFSNFNLNLLNFGLLFRFSDAIRHLFRRMSFFLKFKIKICKKKEKNLN